MFCDIMNPDGTPFSGDPRQVLKRNVDRARELTFIGTRRYVRRQRSWFRRDHRIRWLDGSADGLADTAVGHWRHVSSSL
jgi:tRNA A37 N6-isopentenylltransferase MiaA